MKRIINFRDFNVFTIEKEVWDINYHNHNFYELIIIESGKGLHRLNEVTFPYKEGNVFLLTPSDAHEFIIEDKTKFIYIKFTNQYIQDSLLWSKNSEAKEAMKFLLISNPMINESVIKNNGEAEYVLQLSKLLLYEFVNTHRFSEELIANLFSSIMILLTRNLLQHSDNQKWLSVEGEKIEKILSYISLYALNKDKMKIASLANEFMMSENYISVYVKKQTNMSIQNHVIQYKIRAAEKLLKQSKFNINEIAEKLGFNDASHFNKFFKKYKSLSPNKFR